MDLGLDPRVDVLVDVDVTNHCLKQRNSMITADFLGPGHGGTLEPLLDLGNFLFGDFSILLSFQKLLSASLLDFTDRGPDGVVDGEKPGLQVFVLDAGGDELRQPHRNERYDRGQHDAKGFE